LLTIFSIFCNSFFWKTYLSFFSKKHIPFERTFYIYAKTNLGKYVPGNIGHYASRQFFGTSLEIKQTHLALASVLEVLWAAVSAFLFSVLFMGGNLLVYIKEKFPNMNLPLLKYIFFVSGCAVLAVLFFYFRKHPYFISFILFIKHIHFWFISCANIVYDCFLFLMVGILLMFSINIIGNIHITAFIVLRIIGASVTATFIGFITPGVPGGIGVREGALLFSLSPYFPKEVILISAVLQRFSFVLGDVLAWPLSIVLTKIPDKKSCIRNFNDDK
jgi:uncharacterized membrane protein YbhN (UPF0104 family)